MLAKQHKANLIRLQITEMTSEIDIIGGVDLKSGGFKLAPFLQSIVSAAKTPEQQYFLMLDEFTRGRDEALNVLFPILAERKLVINNPYCEINELLIPDNIKIFATGNLHDTGQRELGQAEMDRYNVIEIEAIKDKNTLKQIINEKVTDMNQVVADKLIDFYLASWQKYDEARILAMSIRTLIETALIANEFAKKLSENNAIKEALALTYYGTSHAIFNPNYKHTYQELIREVIK